MDTDIVEEVDFAVLKRWRGTDDAVPLYTVGQGRTPGDTIMGLIEMTAESRGSIDDKIKTCSKTIDTCSDRCRITAAIEEASTSTAYEKTYTEGTDVRTVSEIPGMESLKFIFHGQDPNR